MTIRRFFELLKEDADYRDNISSAVFASRGRIMEHLMKLYFYGDKDDNVNKHWKDEIVAFLHSVPFLKGSKRYPSGNMLIETLWNNMQDIYERDYKRNIKEFNRKYSERFGFIKSTYEDYNNVKDFIKGYFIWLAIELSVKGEVDGDEIHNKIDELLNSAKNA